ncbi:MAG: GNAT family N-acetyltransferase [Actinobacteria bacterium]|nr:GNAT family N-acetyltransferase [Actinomycetota bacterium]
MVQSNRFCHFGGSSLGSAPGGGGRPARAEAGEPSTPRRWSARAADPSDFEAWDGLFVAYCDFYARPATAEHRRRVWSWIEAGAVRCLVVVPSGEAEGRAVGIAHVRPCPSALRGATTGYLDDLFLDPAARGGGAFEVLLGAVRELAATEGWEIVRWITAADNDRARAAYDRVATRTDWVTYQLDA